MRHTPRSTFVPVALAGLTALLMASTALADVVETGANSPVPIVSGVTNVTVGSLGVGSLTINSASGPQTFTAGTLTTGGGATGNGTLTVTGATTTVSLGTTGQNVLQIGNTGIGTATISGGATVTDIRVAANFGGNGTAIGNGAGAIGALTVTGAGSTATFGNYVTIAGAGVSGTPGNPTGFGVPGATTVGTLNVTAGGALNTNQIGFGSQQIPAANNAANGSEHAFGTGTISGAGSTVTVTAIPTSGGLLLGVGPNGTGSLTVSNGGVLNLTTSNPANPGSLGFGLSLGGTVATPGGSGSLTVNAGAVHFVGPFTNVNSNQAINVGRIQGNGTVLVQNGGIIDGVNAILIGRDGSTGTMTVTGAGSKVTTIATGTLGGGVNAGFVSSAALQATLGPTSTGILNVTNGGEIDITLDANGTFLQAGRRGATGTINITGTNSKIVMAGSNAGLSSVIAIGRNSTGTMNITNGGALIVNDTTPGLGYTGLSIGGSRAQVSTGETAGTGTVVVSGAGSKIDFQGAHGTIEVGYSSTGSLTVNAGGVVNAQGAVVGRNAGANGNLVVDGAGSQLNLAGNDGPIVVSGNQVLNGGARLNVGLAGAGTVTVSNGGAITINPDNPGSAQPGGLFIGGGLVQVSNIPPSNTNVGAGGVGTVNVTGGSTITIGGSATNSVVVVGGNGTGTLNVGGVGSAVNLPSTGAMYVGAAAPGTWTPSVPLSGAVNVSGGASINAGSFLGIGSDGTNNNTGTGSFLLTGGSSVTATNIFVGQHGVFGGNGTVNGAVTNNGGILQVGASPDSLVINGAYTQHGGTINLEIFSDGAGGYLTNSLIFTTPAQVVLDQVNFAFNFMNSIDPAAYFAANGLFDLSDFLFAGDGTTNSPLSNTQLNTIVTAPNFDVVATPEPGTMGLFGVGLAALASVRRRRRRLGQVRK